MDPIFDLDDELNMIRQREISLGTLCTTVYGLEHPNYTGPTIRLRYECIQNNLKYWI